MSGFESLADMKIYVTQHAECIAIILFHRMKRECLCSGREFSLLLAVVLKCVQLLL